VWESREHLSELHQHPEKLVIVDDSVLSEPHAVKCELATGVLRSYGRLRLQVTGWSMFPSVRPSDALIVDLVSRSQVRKGDIVLFIRDKRLFAHRVVATDAASAVLTRGDAMPAPDSPVGAAELLGRVTFIVRGDRYIQPRKSLRLHERIIGTLVHRSEVAFRIIVGIHGRLQQLRIQAA